MTTRKTAALTEEQKNNLASRIGDYRKKYQRPFFVDNYKKTVSSRSYYAAANYDQETDLLELCWVEWPSGRASKENPKKWQYLQRVWVDRDTATAWKEDWYRNQYRRHFGEPDYYGHKFYSMTINPDFCASQITKMFENGHFQIGFKRSLNDYSYYGATFWSAYNKVIAMLNHAVSYSCNPGSKIEQKALSFIKEVKPMPQTIARWPKEFVPQIQAQKGFFFFYDDKNDIFRQFEKFGDKKTYEVNRVVLRDNKLYVFENTFDKNAGWAYVRCSRQKYGNIHTRIVNVEKHKFYDSLKNTQQLYSGPKDEFSFTQICKMETDKDVEMICKMNLPHLANSVTSYALPEVLGTPRVPNATNIAKKYGLTNLQLKMIDQYIQEGDGYRSSSVGKMLSIVNYILPYPLTLRSLGADLLPLLNGVKAVYGQYANRWDSSYYFTKRYLQALSDEDRFQLIKKIGSFPEASVRQMAGDTLSMATYSKSYYERMATNGTHYGYGGQEANSLDDCLLPIERLKFKNAKELERLHNELTGTVNEAIGIARERAAAKRKAEDEEYRKRIEKNNKARFTMEYAEENFLIRLPKTVDEIRQEGAALHHCVGGYAYRHANGETTILFLRKTEAPNTSFYTIEVNNGSVVQIHGFCNKWLGNDPEAAKFVNRWLKKQGFSFTKSQLLCKATGYCSTHDMLPESILED